VIVGVETIDKALIDTLPSLRIVSKYGVGIDTVDVATLRDRNIAFASTPGTNAQAVAELALFLIIAALRRIPEALKNVRSERWAPVTGRLLQGKTVGLVGVGHAGGALADLLSPFGCRVLGFDLAPGARPNVEYVALQELLGMADAVSVHVPLNDATRGLIGDVQLRSMKENAVLVNTSRGPVVDFDALLSALKEGVIAAAGLDVLEDEPPLSWDFASVNNLIVTPHIAGSSEESNLNMGRAAIRGLLDNLDLLST
jgi:phosphoglycerate dehydrogenase-like enzyme